MGTLGDSVSAAIGNRARTLAAAAAAPKPGIARRLSARGRGRGVGAVVGAAALVSAAAWWQDADGTVTPQPDPSPSLDQVTTVTVPFDVVDWAPGSFEPAVACGDAVPATQTNDRGFSLDVTTSTTGQGSPDAPTIEAALRYDGTAMEDAVVSDFTAAVVKDGVVVGFLWPYASVYTDTVMDISATDLFEGARFTVGDWGTSSFSPCLDSPLDGTSTLLEAGTYEVVVVKAVRHSEASLAVIDLEKSNYIVGSPEWGLWAAGSIDCREAIQNDIEYGGGGVPIQCDPVGAAAVGATVDAAAGTVTLPYQARPGPLDLDILLASRPVRWVLEEDLTGDELGWGSAPEESVGPDELTCENTLDQWGWRSLSGSTGAGFADILDPSGVPLTLDTRYVSDAARGTVTVGKSTGAWLVGFTQDGLALYGTATVTLDPNRDLPLDRYADYLRTTLTVTDFEACPGRDEQTFMDDPWPLLIVRAPAVVQDEDGDRDFADYLLIELGRER